MSAPIGLLSSGYASPRLGGGIFNSPRGWGAAPQVAGTSGLLPGSRQLRAWQQQPQQPWAQYQQPQLGSQVGPYVPQIPTPNAPLQKTPFGFRTPRNFPGSYAGQLPLWGGGGLGSNGNAGFLGDIGGLLGGLSSLFGSSGQRAGGLPGSVNGQLPRFGSYAGQLPLWGGGY